MAIKIQEIGKQVDLQKIEIEERHLWSTKRRTHGDENCRRRANTDSIVEM